MGRNNGHYLDPSKRNSMTDREFALHIGWVPTGENSYRDGDRRMATPRDLMNEQGYDFYVRAKGDTVFKPRSPVFLVMCDA